MSRGTQLPTRKVSVTRIMGVPAFAQGLSDVRSGVPFDWRIDSWEYERGRLFGCIAPLNMPLRIGGKLNAKAITLYSAAVDRGFIP
jgi:hypothetical protein